MNSILIEANHLSKTFRGRCAVYPLDLTIHSGECVALAGHNGAGKSTLMKMLLGLLSPTTGAVQLQGKAPTDAQVKTKLGYLPETVSLYPSLTGRETLKFFAKLKKQPIAANETLLETVGILDAADRRVGTYSKGMRQRLALAQALIGQPDILFLDEPTTGLDPASRREFYERIALLRASGVAILLSSHALAELAGQVDRIIIMKQGHKMADGDLTQLRVQAELPTMLTTVCAEPLSSPWQLIGENRWQCAVSEAEKNTVIAQLYREHSPTDIQIQAPSLDDLYADFLKREPIKTTEEATDE